MPKAVASCLLLIVGMLAVLEVPATAGEQHEFVERISQVRFSSEENAKSRRQALVTALSKKYAGLGNRYVIYHGMRTYQIGIHYPVYYWDVWVEVRPRRSACPQHVKREMHGIKIYNMTGDVLSYRLNGHTCSLDSYGNIEHTLPASTTFEVEFDEDLAPGYQGRTQQLKPGSEASFERDGDILELRGNEGGKVQRELVLLSE
ncbi:MAG: hypothetical protein R3C18_17750 [Planctomycetaceae bacterium]